MGSLITKLFRKKRDKSTYQKLELIESKIKELEEYQLNYQLKQKRLVGNLLLYGIGSSVIAFAAFYFAFLPKTYEKRIIYSIPIFLFPVVIILLKNLVAWYFTRRVNSHSERLAELRAEKRDLLDQAKNKETYKDAIEILQRFGGNDRSFITPTRPSASNTPASNSIMERKMVNTSTNMTPAFKTPASKQLMNTASNITTLQQRLNSQQTPTNQNRSVMMAVPGSVAAIRSNTRTPYPIIDSSQKGVMDKMVDYLIGDGPANRFAMICQQCFKHNGMALQEEYEYAAFRCAFCNFFNPAKKLRPLAPRLASEMTPHVNILRPSTSSDSNSDSDTEISKPKSLEVEAEEIKVPTKPDEPESTGDEIEFLEKPEKPLVEKKLE